MCIFICKIVTWKPVAFPVIGVGNPGSINYCPHARFGRLRIQVEPDSLAPVQPGRRHQIRILQQNLDAGNHLGML